MRFQVWVMIFGDSNTNSKERGRKGREGKTKERKEGKEEYNSPGTRALLLWES